MKRGKPFEPGNTAGRGRPKGSRNWATLERETLLNEYATPLIKKCVTEALKGERSALRLCVERLVAPARHQTAAFKMHSIRSASDLPRASTAVLKAASDGVLSVQEAQGFMQLLEQHRRILESNHLASRIEALEQSGGATAGLDLVREPDSSAQQMVVSSTVEEAIGEQ
jgi:hypothetical protein